MLSWPDAQARFAHLRCVIVDEWHELLSTKRGTQTELALARLRRWRPGLRTWGLSATLGDLGVALRALLGQGADESAACLIRADLLKQIVIETLIPDQIERFPWAGHLGLTMLPRVIAAIEANRSTLIFTNTRSQTELWYPGHPGSAPGVGRPDRAAPWLAGQDRARVRGSGTERRPAAGRRLHLLAGPGRGLLAGGLRVASR